MLQKAMVVMEQEVRKAEEAAAARVRTERDAATATESAQKTLDLSDIIAIGDDPELYVHPLTRSKRQQAPTVNYRALNDMQTYKPRRTKEESSEGGLEKRRRRRRLRINDSVLRGSGSASALKSE
jgi:hypothetical protein